MLFEERVDFDQLPNGGDDFIAIGFDEIALGIVEFAFQVTDLKIERGKVGSKTMRCVYVCQDSLMPIYLSIYLP